MSLPSFQERKSIVGVGSALIDILIHEGDAFLEQINAEKGGMSLVSYEYLQKVLEQSRSDSTIVPGGSACNTVIGVANLGGSAGFVGKLGQDEYGRLFEDDLKKNSVSPILFTSSLPTGRVLSIITPDAQRTFLTYLGASETMSPQEIEIGCFDNTAIVHIEGYLLFNHELIMSVLKTAKSAGAMISLDLASYTVVEANKTVIYDIVREYVDILIANEDEALAFTGYSVETKALEALSENVYISALKVGHRGSYISYDNEFIKIEPFSNGEIIDTTGAGDYWAAGFLYGLVNQFPIDQCGKLASMCGLEVCKVVGANISSESWRQINKLYKGGY